MSCQKLIFQAQEIVVLEASLVLNVKRNIFHCVSLQMQQTVNLQTTTEILVVLLSYVIFHVVSPRKNPQNVI